MFSGRAVVKLTDVTPDRVPSPLLDAYPGVPCAVCADMNGNGVMDLFVVTTTRNYVLIRRSLGDFQRR